MSYKKHFVSNDIAPSELFKAVEIGTDLAEVGMDCISRQAAIDGKICIRRSNGVEIYDDYAVPVEYLKQLPSTQPERIKGHWVNGHCDKCNGHAPFWCMASTYHESNFCPNCGAEMEVAE